MIIDIFNHNKADKNIIIHTDYKEVNLFDTIYLRLCDYHFTQLGKALTSQEAQEGLGSITRLENP